MHDEVTSVSLAVEMQLPCTRSGERAEDNGPLVAAFAFAALLVCARVLSPGIPDTGDGVGHFQHARYFWSHAVPALSLWGKPVFSLLASPFTFLGLWGTCAFAAACVVVACWCMLRIIRTGQAASVWEWWVPVVCFSTPVLDSTVIAGLTEPLFGAMSLAVVHAVVKRRYDRAVVLTSLLPFTRPEYAAFAPFVLFIVVRDREWSALRYGLLGPLVYILLSWLLLGEPWILFTRHTYLGNDIYGRGGLSHFVDRADIIFGAPFTWLFVAAVVGAALLWWKDRGARGRNLTVYLLTAIPALGILALHSFAWWQGAMGSLGLDRVLATAVPLASLFIVHVLAGLWAFVPHRSAWSRSVPVVILLIYAGASLNVLAGRLGLPVPEDELQRTVRRAAEWVVKEREPGQRVIYLDPFLGALVGVDPWDEEDGRLFNGISALQPGQALSKGDLIVWDAHFTAYEGRVEPEVLDADPRLGLIHTFAPREPIMVIGDRPYSIRIYRYEDPQRTPWADTLFVADASFAMPATLHHRLLFDGDHRVTTDTLEFPLTLEGIPFGDPALVDEKLVVSGTVVSPLEPATLHLELMVDPTGHSPEHRSWDLPQGAFRFEIPAHTLPAGPITKLYLWNRMRARTSIEGLTIVRSGFRLPTP